MRENPYKYLGPLDPASDRDKLIFISREKELAKVKEAINKNNYCAIFAPRQTGKTTFLRQIKHEYLGHTCILISLELTPPEPAPFYNWIRHTIEEACGYKQDFNGFEYDDPASQFLSYLKHFKIKGKNKIIFIFDEIGGLSEEVAEKFLSIWRVLYHERGEISELERFVVIISGAVDLLKFTFKETSPFNIAEKIYLSDFDEKQVDRLLSVAKKKLEIKFDDGARNKLIAQTSGHPQILQHLCSILIGKALEDGKKSIGAPDIDNAIGILFNESDNLKGLLGEIKYRKISENLLRKIQKNKKVAFNRIDATIREAELAGIITNRENYCVVRNEIYKKLIKGLTQDQDYISKQNMLKKTILTLTVLSGITAIISAIISTPLGFAFGAFLAGSAMFTSLIYLVFRKKND